MRKPALILILLLNRSLRVGSNVVGGMYPSFSRWTRREDILVLGSKSVDDMRGALV